MNKDASRKITTDNWSHTQYNYEGLRAFISFGAHWDFEKYESSEIIYFVTVLDEEENEVFQSQFQTLELACEYINERYQNEWPIIDLNNPPNQKEGGCASCVAH